MLLPPLLIIGDGTRTKSVKQIDGIQEIALSSGQCDVSACAREHPEWKNTPINLECSNSVKSNIRIQ